MPSLEPRDLFMLTFCDWISALVLARISTKPHEVAMALDATSRMRAAIDDFEISLKGSIDAAAPLGRLRNRLDSASRWLLGKKSSGTMTPPPRDPPESE
jgi:hypothetical protein